MTDEAAAVHSLVDSFRASLRSPFLPCIVHLSLHPSHSATVIGINGSSFRPCGVVWFVFAALRTQQEG